MHHKFVTLFSTEFVTAIMMCKLNVAINIEKPAAIVLLHLPLFQSHRIFCAV